MPRLAPTVGAVLVVLSRSLFAQASGSIDLGTAILHQPSIGSSGVLTAAGELSYLGSAGELSANGVAARTPNDLYTGQGVLRAARYASPFHQARWELAATGSVYGVSGLAPSFGGQLLGREHVGGLRGGGFVGVTAGTVGQGGVWQRVLGGQGGGFLRLGSRYTDELSVALAYTDATSAGFGPATRYADVFGYWDHQDGIVDLLVGGGARASTAGSLGTSGWASGSATLWMTPRMAIVLSTGRALADVTRAVPSVRYLSFALRFGQQHASSPIILPAHRQDLDHETGYLDVRGVDDSTRVITIRADSASTVELMADFTDWEPVALTRVPNGRWSLTRPVAAGVHHVAIRIDGGPWLPPPNLTKAPDDFGGQIGLLAVP